MSFSHALGILCASVALIFLSAALLHHDLKTAAACVLFAVLAASLLVGVP